MSVRILRGAARGEPSRRKENALFLPTARKIAACEWDARLKTGRVVAEARAAAEREGYEEGRARAHAEAIALLAHARADVEETTARAIDVVKGAARAVSERALGRALAIDDATLVGWAEQALASLAGSRRIVLRGARATLDRLASLAPPDGVVAFELQAVDDLPEGAVHARSDVGEVTVDLATQVRELVEAIHDVIAARVARGPAAGAPVPTPLGARRG